MPMYRKKPAAPFEARRLTDDADWHEIARWCGGDLVNREVADTGEYATELRVPMLFAEAVGIEGDYVARGGKGSFFLMDAERFKSLYEAADEVAE